MRQHLLFSEYGDVSGLLIMRKNFEIISILGVDVAGGRYSPQVRSQLAHREACAVQHVTNAYQCVRSRWVALGIAATGDPARRGGPTVRLDQVDVLDRELRQGAPCPLSLVALILLVVHEPIARMLTLVLHAMNESRVHSRALCRPWRSTVAAPTSRVSGCIPRPTRPQAVGGRTMTRQFARESATHQRSNRTRRPRRHRRPRLEGGGFAAPLSHRYAALRNARIA
jgi:hypothetical protein